ncbi:MAG: hypothetical protein R8K50_11010 [Mariprofundus sp.]
MRVVQSGAQAQVNGQVPHASWKLLTVLFVVSLALFLSLRWQPEPWLRGQIMAATQPYGMDVEFQQLEVDGLAVRLQKIQISGGSLPAPLQLDSVRLAPAWMQLLQGIPAVFVNVSWQGVDVATEVSLHDQQIELADIRFSHDIAALATMLNLSVPVQLGGVLALSGVLRSDATGRPLAGKLVGQWQQAAASMSGEPELLGNYKLELANEDPEKPWQWQLTGGDGLIVKGDGTLTMPSNVPQQWMLGGQLNLAAGQTLPPALKPFLPQPISFIVTGPLLRPVVQPRQQ